MRDVQMADAELTAAGEAAPIVTSASQTAPPTAALADRVMTSLDDAAMVDVVRTATPSPAASCEEEAKSSLSGEQQQQASMPADSASMEITPAASLDPTPSSVASVISVASVPSAGPAAAALSSTLVLPSAIGAPTSAPQLDAPVDPFDPKLHWVQAGSYVDKDPTKPLQLPCALQLVHECAALETNVIPAKAVASAQKDNIKNKWKEQDCWLALRKKTHTRTSSCVRREEAAADSLLSMRSSFFRLRSCVSDCTEQLGSMEISRTNGANGTASSHPAPLKPTGHLVMLAALIYTLGARVDAQGQQDTQVARGCGICSMTDLPARCCVFVFDR
jgi:hypothetical protein